MPIDELLRERIGSIEIDADPAAARTNVASRSARLARRRRAASATSAAVLVAGISLVGLAVRSAPSTGTLIDEGGALVRAPSCGPFDLEEPLLFVDVSGDGATIAMITGGSFRGTSVVVCRDGRAARFARGRGQAFAQRDDIRPRERYAHFVNDGLAVGLDGSKVYYDAFDRLTPADRNDTKDVYELDVASGSLRRIPIDLARETDVGTPRWIRPGIIAVHAIERRAADLVEATLVVDVPTGTVRSKSPGQPSPRAPDRADDRYRAVVEAEVLPLRELFRDPSARPRTSIVVEGPTGLIRRHDLPEPPPGTIQVGVGARVSPDGSRLAYTFGSAGLEPFSDGAFVKEDDPLSPFADEVGEGGSPKRFMTVDYVSHPQSPMLLVDLRTGTAEAVGLPHGYGSPALLAGPSFTSDGRHLFITASLSSSRPERATRDLLVLDTDTRALRVLTWSPPPWVRYENAIAWSVLVIVSLAGVLAWSAIHASGRRPLTAFYLASFGLLLGPAAWWRMLGEGRPWLLVGWFAGVALIAVLVAAPLTETAEFVRLVRKRQPSSS